MLKESTECLRANQKLKSYVNALKTVQNWWISATVTQMPSRTCLNFILDSCQNLHACSLLPSSSIRPRGKIV